MSPATFSDRALAAVQRGLSIIPCRPRSKNPLAKNGAKSRVNTEEGVCQFAAQVPEDCNYGICSDERFTILETDDRAKLTELLGKPVPTTLCVSARPNRGYWVFAQTPKSLAVKGSPKAGGIFEWRHTNQYCVGFGSIHPDTGAEYKLVSDVTPASMPDWLVDKLLEISKGRKEEAAVVVSVPAEKGNFTYENVEGLLTALQARNPAFDFEKGKPSAGRGWNVRCWNAEQHTHETTELNSSTVVWVNERGFADAHCSHNHCGYGWREFVAKWGVYDLQSAITNPLAPMFGSGVGIANDETEEAKPIPKYPADVWEGTNYGEFADICARDNYIPREFLIEAIKTVTGAVLGSALSIPEIEGGIPRFYTVLMGGAGSGKGTSISWASSVFKDISLGGTAIANLLWSPATKIETVKWTMIGACEEGFNSAPGMQRSNHNGQKRWLQTFEELDHMIEGSGIDGSGKALMGVNRQLYDREDFSTTTTGKRDAIAGKAQNSILSATTPEIWTDMFAGKSVRGSGLFQRFNLVVSDESRKKGSLRKPRLDLFKMNFATRVFDMDKKPVEVTVPDKVLGAMDEWFTQEKFSNPEVDGEVRGRLNVLAWRNALHLAWQRGLFEIGMRELMDAFRLSEYQFEMRIRHTPAEGDNPWALVENKIRNFLKVQKKASRRDIVRTLNLHRYGGGTTDKAFASLRASGEIELFEMEKTGPKSVFAVWQE